MCKLLHADREPSDHGIVNAGCKVQALNIGELVSLILDLGLDLCPHMLKVQFEKMHCC